MEICRLFPAFKPHEIPKLPKHYYQTLRDYYFMVHPPRQVDDDDEDFTDMENRTIDFDKMTVRRRALMRHDWDQDAKKGDLV